MHFSSYLWVNQATKKQMQTNIHKAAAMIKVNVQEAMVRNMCQRDGSPNIKTNARRLSKWAGQEQLAQWRGCGEHNTDTLELTGEKGLGGEMRHMWAAGCGKHPSGTGGKAWGHLVDRWRIANSAKGQNEGGLGKTICDIMITGIILICKGTSYPKCSSPWMVNLLSPEPVFQVAGSKMTFPEQMTISSLLKGLN